MSEWGKFITLVEEFIYGNNGVFENASDSDNMDTYILDTDKVIIMLKQYNKVLEVQGSLTEEQQRKLDRITKTFLDMDNGNKKIIEIYNSIKDIYENLEDYID